KVMLSVHEGVPVAFELPQKATLEVVETESSVKGQTAASSYKPALLSNGVRTLVPPFVGPGTKIVVMTAHGSYVERAKDWCVRRFICAGRNLFAIFSNRFG